MLYLVSTSVAANSTPRGPNVIGPGLPGWAANLASLGR